jgi:hypothetical protein
MRTFGSRDLCSSISATPIGKCAIQVPKRESSEGNERECDQFVHVAKETMADICLPKHLCDRVIASAGSSSSSGSQSNDKFLSELLLLGTTSII